MNVNITGVGTSNFGKQSASIDELAWQAIEEALENSGLDATDIDAAFVGTVFGGPGIAHRVLRGAGIARPPVLTVENACASGTTALHLAWEAVQSRRAKRAIALGIEKMSNSIKGAISPEQDDVEGRSGLALPALYALTAHRYMAIHDVRLTDLASVSVKNHANALGNPRAQYSGDYTVDDVLESRPIADPLTLLQCSPISDGAAAAIVQPEADAGQANAIRIRATSFESGAPWPLPDDRVWNFELIERTAKKAFNDAGLDVQDVDVFEVHDAFTIGEIVTTEALGLAPEGQGACLIREGITCRDGSMPVNTSGGLLSRGHPLGATGLAQVAEVVWQLTGRAEERQLSKADVGLVETMGGNVAGLNGNGCIVCLLDNGKG